MFRVAVYAPELMASAEHLREHQYKFVGDEPLSPKPFSVRLYKTDDDILRPLDQGFAVFIREAVREKLQQDGSRRTS